MIDGFKIVVVGSRTGVGKTFFSANLFTSLIENNIACNLVDEHIQRPSLRYYFNDLPEPIIEEVVVRIPEISIPDCTFCGSCVKYCNYDAILMLKESNHIKVLDDYCTSCGACVYACNDNAISEHNEIIGRVSTFEIADNQFVEGEMSVVRPMASPFITQLHSHVDNSKMSIVDGPPGNSFSFTQSVKSADFVILVADESLKSLNGLKDKIRIMRNLACNFGIVINKKKAADGDLYDYLKEENYIPLLEIPYKKEYAISNSDGEFVVKSDLEIRDSFLSLFSLIRTQIDRGAR